MLKDEHTDGPQLGDLDVVSTDEIGWDRTRELAKHWKSPRADIVKAVLANSSSPQAIMARQWVKHPTKHGSIMPRTTAVTATGHTKAGDAVAATHMALIRPTTIFGTHAETIRFATDTMGLTKGEAEPVFGAVGHMHVFEANSFRQANFEAVSEIKVASSALRAVREWTRGKDLIWLVLPSMEAKRAAADMRDKLEAFEAVEGHILAAQAKGIEPDERMLRKYNELRVGLDAYWFFIGVQRKVAFEREPSLDAIVAAGKAGLITR